MDSVENIKLSYVFYNNKLTVTNFDFVYGMGENTDGILGLGHDIDVKEPKIIPELCQKRIIDFKNGSNFCVARSNTGNLYSFGSNGYNQLGYYTNKINNNKPKLIDCLKYENVVEVCCGKYHTLALTQNSEVFSWGDNKCGQIGIDSNIKNQFNPVKIFGFNGEKIQRISCGGYHSMALTVNGNVFSWGDNAWGQIGIEEIIKESRFPRIVKIGCNEIFFIKITCGSRHSLILSTIGEIYSIGYNDNSRYNPLSGFSSLYNQCLSMPSPVTNLLPQTIKIELALDITDIIGHWSTSFSTAFSSRANKCYIWGKCNEEFVYPPRKTNYKSCEEAFLNVKQRTINVVENNSEDKVLSYKDTFVEENIISIGGFGIVSKALNKEDNKYYAIKRIAFDDEFQDKVFRGTEIMKELRSDFVINVEKVWIEENYLKNDTKEQYMKIFTKKQYFHPVLHPNNKFLLHIQMELCFTTFKDILIKIKEELNEKDYVIKSLFSFHISSELLIELLECVEFLHSRVPKPVIHRDLKPSNILITYGLNGRFLKLGDFGLSKEVDSFSQTNTSMVGTQGFIAPEVIKGRNYTTKADLYSLGSFIDQIFNFDLNEFKLENIENNELKIRYTNIVEIQRKMTSYVVKERIDCFEILQSKTQWSLNTEHLIHDEEFYNFYNRQISGIDDNFCAYFIQQKTNSKSIRDRFNTEKIRSKNKIVLSLTIRDNFFLNNYLKQKHLYKGEFSDVFTCLNVNTKEISAVKRIEINVDEVKQKAIYREQELKNDLIVQYKLTWMEHKENLILMNDTMFLFIEMELCLKTLKQLNQQLRNELFCKSSLCESHIGFYIMSELMKEVIEGVNYLHKNNIIHRNLKPQNILITDYNINGKYVRITGFGLSSIHTFRRDSIMREIKYAKYIAPEIKQWFHRKNKKLNYDNKADIYSLGAIMEEMFDLNIKINNREKNYKNFQSYAKYNIGEFIDLKIYCLNEIKKEMVSLNSKSRPSCDQLLKKLKESSINFKDLNKLMKSELIQVEDSNEIHESMHENFYKYFLNNKLI